MSSLYWPPLAMAGAALLLWPLFGPVVALFLFSAGLLVLLWRHAAHLSALTRWLRAPSGAMDVPEGAGAWGDVFNLLYQSGRARSSGEHQLSAALERFQRAAEAMPDGIVMLDEADRISWCNPVAEVQFGISDRRDHGQPIAYLVRQAQFNEYLAASSHAGPLVMKSARNADLKLSIQLVPYGDRQKLLLSRDVTQLERVETMRRDFIANVSHELRTPLTVVGGFLENFADAGQIDRAQDGRHLQLMLEQTRRMQRLVDDLLTLSRLENSQERMSEAEISMPVLLDALCREAQSLSGARHAVKLEIGANCGLLGNERDLYSAFGNLVSNAVRYTPEGGSIVLRWEMRGEEACFSVQDNGIGIAPQYLGRLTERFFRVDSGRSRETGGTGLGLSIVKHVLTRHQGRLEISSEPGTGSIFRACFPARRVLT